MYRVFRYRELQPRKRCDQVPSWADLHSFKAASIVKPLPSGISLNQRLDALDDDGSLALELFLVARVTLLFAVLETVALVVLEQSMLAAKVAFAEAAVADDALCSIAALLVGTPLLLGRHTAAQRCR